MSAYFKHTSLKQHCIDDCINRRSSYNQLTMLVLAAVALLLATSPLPSQSTSALLAELICATNITLSDINVPNDVATANPAATLTDTLTPVIFEIADKTLQNLYYVQIDTTTVTAEAFLSDGVTQTGNTQSYAEMFTGGAIAQTPKTFDGCAVIGCDGFELDSVAFLQLFPSNATYFSLSATLDYYGNASSSSSVGFSTLGVGKVQTAPAGTTLVGTTVATMNLTASSSVQNSAFPGSSSSTLWCGLTSSGGCDGVAVAIAVAGVLLLGFMYWLCQEMSRNRRKDMMATRDRMAGTADVGARYANTGTELHHRGTGAERKSHVRFQV